MSLLLNADFTLYNLRLGYLQNINDGVGERLIHLNAAVLSDPAFKAAGFAPDNAAIKRCYSPPIPTTGAAEYFTRPVRSRQGYTLNDGETPDEDAGGLITGRNSEDTLGPVAVSEKEKRRRRQQRERMEEDDSSDLSDDSDEEETAAQGVRFAKVKERQDSSLSPPQLRTLTRSTGPEVNVISPSFRPRTSSLTASDVPQGVRRTGRARGDTITSSEFSSESEMLDVGTTFGRKLPSRLQKTAMLASKIAEEDSDLEDEDDEEDAEVAEASDLSDDFEGDDIADSSANFFNIAGGVITSPLQDAQLAAESASPQKITALPVEPTLEALPGLPLGQRSYAKPAPSLIGMALRGDTDVQENANTFQKYAELSGKGEASPLWIKIYYPFARGKPLEVPLRRLAADGPPKVNDLIGLALYLYEESGSEPKLKGGDLRLTHWELRMMDDGEVEMDFPALNANRPITDFTSNNNRPPQRRARDKPWDEFGLVHAKSATATDEENEPQIAEARRASVKSIVARPAAPPVQPSMVSIRNPITGPMISLAPDVVRKDSTNLLDIPAAPTTTSTPRTGPQKDVIVHFTDPQSFNTQHITVETTADTYIAEIFDTACARLTLDKALYVLKVRRTQTVAPSDRTVEALGANLHLDLSRRRFGAVGDFGLGTSSSPGSTSPNAPLELVPNTPPTGKDARRRRPGVQGVQTMAASMLNLRGVQDGRRYHVLRKQPLSFSASHPRTLVITPEFLQVLPAQNAEDGPVSGKVTNIHMSSIVGVKVSRKHPKLVRVVVYREKEAKRYDFECATKEEAQAIVSDVRVGVGEYSGSHD